MGGREREREKRKFLNINFYSKTFSDAANNKMWNKQKHSLKLHDVVNLCAFYIFFEFG